MSFKYRKPHRLKRKKPIWNHRFFGITILFLVAIISVSYFLFFSHFFEIEKIIVWGEKKAAEEEIIKLIEKNLSQKRILLAANNIFWADLDQTKEDILAQFPEIGELSFDRSFPQTLNCHVTERVPRATFCQSFAAEEGEGENCFLLDKLGIAFEEVSTEDILLPKIQKSGQALELKLGKSIISPQLISNILEIFSQLTDMEIGVQEINILSQERINARTTGGWEIYFNPQKDLTWQLTKLRAVLDKYILPQRRSNLEYIELRFGNLAPFKYQGQPEQ